MTIKPWLSLCCLFLASCFGALLPAAAQEAPATTLIQDVTVVDGTGAPAFEASVRLRGEAIDEVGDLHPQAEEAVVGGEGLVLAPGFIDTHSHHDADGDPDVPAAVTQGITTIIVGQDGRSQFPLADFFESLDEEPFAVNVASYVGHNTLRSEVMGDDFRREATEEEVSQMGELLRQGLEAGALGLSTGLEYDPGIYASTDEVIGLAKEAQQADGRYISHIRSEDRYLEEAIEEIIEIGQEAEIPVQISHMKLARRSLWGEADRILERLDEARDEGVVISADVYPYTYWQSSMTVLFPERNFDDREAAGYALTELTSSDDMIVADFSPDTTYVGKTIAEIAELRDTDPVTTYMELIQESQADEQGSESVIARSMDEQDIKTILRWPHSNVSSDGSARSGHPRGWGAFPRVLRAYMREGDVLSLEEAIHKMTGLSAQHVGLPNRGLIREGAPADLVLFDPDTITDRATIEAPDRPSEGIIGVWVNGTRVQEDNTGTGARPGKVLRRSIDM